MITFFLKRTVVLIMVTINLFSFGAKEWGDSCADFDFPRIGAAQQEKDTVRVMSFNIRCGDVNGVSVPDRIGIAVRQIKEVMPDTLGIQEATPEWMQALDLQLPLYDWVGINRETGTSPKDEGESCPIFYLKSKYKLEDSGNFWLSDTPDEPSFGPGAGCKRICTWAKLRDRLTGRTLVHVNTHFDHVSEEARVAGARIVTDFIADAFAGLPVVFTADMNTFVGAEAYNTMTEDLNDARMTAEDAVTFGTFHACSPETHADYYIDFILCSDDIQVKTYRTLTRGVDDRFVSDHFPICADVVLPGRGARRPVC